MTPKFGATREDQIGTLTWAILFNLVWFGICVYTICKESAKHTEFYDKDNIKFELMSDESR